MLMALYLRQFKSIPETNNTSDIDILDLCKEVAIATGEFAHDYSEDSEHSKSLFG